jgi:hypothetical protein
MAVYEPGVEHVSVLQRVNDTDKGTAERAHG